MCGLQRGRANHCGIRAGANRKNGQQPVAHEFQHFAALLDDRGHLAIEIPIKQADQSLRRQPVGKSGEPAHIGQPDRGMDRLGIATADAAGKNALAGMLAYIGRQQITGDTLSRANFGNPRQWRDDAVDGGDFRLGEAARLFRRPRGKVNGAGGKVQRRDHIVSHALGAQVGQNRKIHRAIRIGEIAAQRFSGRADIGHRAVAKNIALQQFEAAVGDLRSGIRPPDETAGRRPADAKCARTPRHAIAAGRRRSVARTIP